MGVRVPEPLVAGDCIGVTCPSSGVDPRLWPRLQFAIETVRDRGFEVLVGECMDGSSHVSAPKQHRADELQRMLLDPRIRAIVPPWGGETAIDLLDLLDWDAIAAADPTWVVGYSDLSTILTPLTLRTGVATVHGQNLMDTPYPPPPGLVSWIDVVTHDHATPLTQTASGLQAPPGRHEWGDDPMVTTPRWTEPGQWTRLDTGTEPVDVTGRLIGGCIETLCNLAGTDYLDLNEWAKEHVPEGLIVYVEAAQDEALSICRNLHGMRLARCFHNANAVLVGRTHAPDAPTLTQREAVLDALDGVNVPILGDIECGHVGPFMPLVNGALARVEHGEATSRLTQHLC